MENLNGNTKQFKPILIPTDKSYLYLHESKLYNNRTTQHIPDGKQQPKHIILVDTEAEIVEGDLVYSSKGTPNIQKVEKNLNTSEYRKSIGWNKIISSTNKSHKLYEAEILARASGFSLKTDDILLPQLSPQSIQLLINYYNEFKCMSESVVIKEEQICFNDCDKTILDENDLVKLQYKIKLNQQGEVDITIPEVDRFISIDRVNKYGSHQHYLGSQNKALVKFEEWSNQKEKRLYTEEDLYDAFLAGANFDKDSLKVERYYAFTLWFNSKKK